MPDDIPTPNDLTEQRLNAEYEQVLAVHRQAASPETLAELQRTQAAQDSFWETLDGHQGNYVTRPDVDYAQRAADTLAENPERLQRELDEWVEYQVDTGVQATPVELAGSPATAPEWLAANGYTPTNMEVLAAQQEVDDITKEIGPYNGGEVDHSLDRDLELAEAHLVEVVDADEQAIAQAVGVMKSPTSAANFADEVDAWYQAVQPTGEIRRVRDEDLFDRNGYSQQPDAVAVQAGPVSEEFAALHRPVAGSQRWESRMNQNPSLAAAVARHPVNSQGPTLPVAAPTMKL